VRAQEMRELTSQKLVDELDDSQKELLKLRFRIVTKQLANTSELGRVRKNIARLNTIIRERQLGVG